ncbi:MAG: hypothetical protein IPL95_14125 [Saprospiraceae bacterium]|nr:hypothetical protein [Saprospiraceae bacterium]
MERYNARNSDLAGTRYSGASHQIIIIKEAQDFKDYSNLVNYAKNPTATTLLLLCHKQGKMDARTTFFKALKEKATIFESNKIPDYNLLDWVIKYLHPKNYISNQMHCSC